MRNKSKYLYAVKTLEFSIKYRSSRYNATVIGLKRQMYSFILSNYQLVFSLDVLNEYNLRFGDNWFMDYWRPTSLSLRYLLDTIEHVDAFF